MSKKKIIEMLEKQLQLLSERSTCFVEAHDLADLTDAMVRLVEFLISQENPAQGGKGEF